MRIATILFTYHRSEHTRKVLEALSINTQKPEKLFIFQDGIGAGTNVTEWKKVKEMITNITWCDTEVHIAIYQKGCARSIIEGINYILKEFEAIIVLEDDCVPYPQFISYMKQTLEKYVTQPKVYSIGGYAWDIDLPPSNMDAYFNGRTSSWGWGTWKDRWIQFQEDYQLIRRIERTEEGKRKLDIWGADLKNMVVGNIMGSCDAWDVFWSLTVIANDGVCLSPYKSLIHNIGMDGSGTHGVIRNDNCINYNDNKSDYEFVLPDEITVSRECKLEFYNMFSEIHGVEKIQLYQQVLLSWIKKKQRGGKLKKNIFDSSIAIWGKGKICDLLLNELQEITDIECILETYPSTYEYQGIPICGITELPDEVKNIVVIPFFDIERIEYQVRKWKEDIKLIGIDKLVEKIEECLEEI